MIIIRKRKRALMYFNGVLAEISPELKKALEQLRTQPWERGAIYIGQVKK